MPVVHGILCRDIDVPIVIDCWETNAYEWDRKVQSGDVALDIGAHVGTWSVLVSGRAKKVIAFEPEPENFSFLLQNVKPYPNIEAHNQALWSSSGKATLRVAGANTGSHSLIKDYVQSPSKEIEVELVKLDDVIHEKVNFIKMDAEGSEMEIIKGASRVLQDHPVIALEAHVAGWWADNDKDIVEKWWQSFNEVVAPFNYRILRYPPPNDLAGYKMLTLV
jgi:FkbM family methyltransferase